MITIYSGVPGSGKSYHAASDAYDFLASGCSVLANTEFKIGQVCSKNEIGKLYYALNEYITPERLIAHALHNHVISDTGLIQESQTLIVIDEAQNLFNSRDWKNPNRPLWTEFFQQHRKLGYDVLLISQDPDMVDKQIRSCIQVEVNHRLAAHFGKFWRLFSFLFGKKGKLFAAVKREFQTRAECGIEFIRPFDYVKDFYDTSRLFDSQYIDYEQIRLSIPANAFAELAPPVEDRVALT